MKLKGLTKEQCAARFLHWFPFFVILEKGSKERIFEEGA